MANRPYNAFEAAQAQFDRIADILELETAVRDILRNPMREYHFNIPIKMDDGSSKVAGVEHLFGGNQLPENGISLGWPIRHSYSYGRGY